ncbi:hypothetical protein [Agathobaculum desmolans]|nr:hypothetical protein [Agathobaculum desmolans]
MENEKQACCHACFSFAKSILPMDASNTRSSAYPIENGSKLPFS